MASDGACGGGGTAVGRLAALLTAAGKTPPTPLELAEVLWLAARLEDGRQQDAAGAPPAAPAADGDRPPDSPAPPTGRTHRGEGAAAVPPAPLPPTDRVPLHLPAPAPAPQPTSPSPSSPSPSPSPSNGQGHGGGTPLLAPAPPMLPRPLALQRALRPLKRTVPSARARLLDERATADRIARLGAHPDVWLPVLRPAHDRWLRLSLVHDTGPTMPVWRPLVRELHAVLAQSGVFRTVTLHPAGPDGRAPHVPDPADGRTVTLVVSDCMGPQWRPGPAGDRWYGTLRRWAARMPLAVVQPLPEHLWPATALPALPGVLVSPSAAAPATALAFTPYDEDAPRPHPAAVPLPVLEPGAPWLAHWAALLAAPGGARAPGAAAWLGPRPGAPAPDGTGGDPADPADLPARDLVLRFRATASPEAFRLAGHLALAVPSVPVMRLVQRAVDRDPRPQHLAEVILSGMLTAVPGPAGAYAFRPGVRDLLLRTLPRTARGRTRELLERVGGLIDDRAGLAAGEFRAAPGDGSRDDHGDDHGDGHGDRGGDGDGDGQGNGRAFATVSAETVRRLGGDAPRAARQADGEDGEEDGGTLLAGRYRLLERRGPGRRLWRAVDERTGEPVAVHLYPERQAPQERFLREARALAELDDPHVVRVRDFGVEGDTPFLIVEFDDGVTLTELVRGSGPGVSFAVFARLVCGGTAGLDALHRRGLVRGQDGPEGLLLRPDGSAVLGRFALGEESRQWNVASDTAAFHRLLRQLAPHVPAPDRFRPLLTRIAEGPLPPAAPALLAAAGDTESLDVRMLGPLRVGGPRDALTPPSPEAQALLCLLVLRSGRRMTYDELATGVWDRPPAGSEAARRVDALATELRRLLGPGTLATTSDGWALHAGGARVDVFDCEDVLADRSPDGDPDERRAALEHALGRFRGDPLDGVPGPAARRTRSRLRALRIALRAALAELDLRLGAFDSAESALEALLREDPHNDEVHRLRARARARDARRDRAPRPRPTLLFAADTGLGSRPEARISLEYAVHQVLARGDLTPQQYEVRVLPDGYRVHIDPDAYLLPVLAAVLRWLPGPLADLANAPRLRVTFRDGGPPDDEPVPLSESTAESSAESPTTRPTGSPTGNPTASPTGSPTGSPTTRPTGSPTGSPTTRPTGSPAGSPAESTAPVRVLVPPALYGVFADSSAASGPHRFRPLFGGTPDEPPVAWYCTLPAHRTDDEERDLVRGPFITPDLGQLGIPAPGRTAVVHTRPDGPLTLLDPARPHGASPPRPTTYYEVDLTPHRATRRVSLPSSGKGDFTGSVELSWWVTDPVAFVHGQTARVADRLLAHLLETAPRITRRHPLRRSVGAQRAVNAQVGGWPVPGLAVRCETRLGPEWAPPPEPSRAAPAARPADETAGRATPAALLAGADIVLLGFDGPLVRLFTATTARRAAHELLALAAEHRSAQDAPTGRPPAVAAGRESMVHPLDVLRVFARDPLGPSLRARLDTLELAAVPVAPVTHRAVALVNALHSAGRRVAVVTDVCERAVHRAVESYRLPPAGVHGRGPDLSRLTPDPDCLLRALRSVDAPAPTGVLITSSVAELTAAQQIGLRTIGLARNATAEQELREAGCEVAVRSLAPALEAARSL
ncbi:SAV_2336 N-terminal domain-related protein [Streptomyces sp. NPDC088812]|uniref:SAV_2336 N-terminal domain-related protein n=1 Tax=Streptomyces sp. NPDC088812 TaxID=3365905 RepID=UPI00382F2ADF